MDKLENWTEVTKGLYRYVIAANACYEIQIMYRDLKKPLEDSSLDDAEAICFLTGEWHSKIDERDYFARHRLGSGTLKECLTIAKRSKEEDTE